MNKDYVIHDAEGEIIRIGSCPEEELPLQVFEGEHLVEGVACCIKDAVNPATGEIIPGGRKRPLTTGGERPPAPAAPMPVEQQLDLLWQAMDAGTFPKAEPFYSAIKAAKDAQG